MEKRICEQTVERISDELISISRILWENPEVAYEEKFAAELTAEVLRKYGFRVEERYLGIPTCIRAEWGSGSPVIGLLSEFDALPGMSQKAKTVKEPVETGKAGHACGHNLLNTACIGGAIALKEELEARKMSGTIVFYGCPAEEVLTGKPLMAREGAFRELDLAIAFHPYFENAVTKNVYSGVNSVKFHFKGKPAHASREPENGRSALDAVELMNVGANYLREHIAKNVQLHYTITDGGGLPNVVPEKASVWYYIRSMSRSNIDSTYERLIDIAKGAALMTGTSFEIEFLGGCYETLSNHTIADVIVQAFSEVAMPVWTAEEEAFAKEIDQTTAKYQRLAEQGIADDGTHLCTEAPNILTGEEFGSTDIADVMHIVPCTQFDTTTWSRGSVAHMWQAAACAGMSIGQKGMLHAARVMAAAAMIFAENPELVQKAKEEFAQATKNETYKSPIPADFKVPELK